MTNFPTIFFSNSENKQIYVSHCIKDLRPVIKLLLFTRVQITKYLTKTNCRAIVLREIIHFLYI